MKGWFFSLVLFFVNALRGAVYDCFLLFDEIELLKLRFEELHPVVDYFVCVEGKKSFFGKDKPLFLQENQALFHQYKDKLIHLVIDSFPTLSTQIEPSSPFYFLEEDEAYWFRKNYSFNYILNALTNCQENDIIFLSDINEIPSPKSIQEIKKYLTNLNQQRQKNSIPLNDFVCELGLKWLAYYLNRQNPQIRIGGCKAVPYWFLKTYTPSNLRVYHLIHHDTKKFLHAGWFFDTMGGRKRALFRWQNQELIFDKETLIRLSQDDNFLEKTFDEFCIEYTISTKIDQNYPRYILDHINDFRSIGWIQEQ